MDYQRDRYSGLVLPNETRSPSFIYGCAGGDGVDRQRAPRHGPSKTKSVHGRLARNRSVGLIVPTYVLSMLTMNQTSGDNRCP